MSKGFFLIGLLAGVSGASVIFKGNFEFGIAITTGVLAISGAVCLAADKIAAALKKPKPEKEQ
ncbi:MAG: hypothetical protein HGB08_01460 [Candidatus Moranbacteria bacterium]|nr:hypothetical protein [Candidatus Moranbacteria bacterium]